VNIVHIDFSPNTRSLDIFVSGCKPPYCDDCCNIEIADFKCGTYWMNHIDKIITYLKEYDNLIDNIFLLGGSFNHQNSHQLKMFFSMLKEYNNKEVWLFAREELPKIKSIFLKNCNYIKCGEYIPELTTDNNIQFSLKLATSNQKVFKKGIDY
jgi:hypothetical protein